MIWKFLKQKDLFPKGLNWYNIELAEQVYTVEALKSKDGEVMRALSSHQCGPGSNPGVDAICGLSLLLILSLAPRGFSPGTPVFPSP